MQIKWGEPQTDENFEAWYQSLKSQEITIDKPLLPGMWNNVTAILSPATAKETGFISLNLITNGVNLHSDTRK